MKETNVDKETMKWQKRILGVLCILLAPLSVLFGLFGCETNLPFWYGSISATFYANSNIIMIGTLFSVSVFFFAYKCYDWFDRVVTIIEAICAMGVIMFPVASPGIPEKVGIFCLPYMTSNTFHCVFAILLFLVFALQLIFVFTRGAGEPTENKKIRNKIYIGCGITILASASLHFASQWMHLPAWFPATLVNEWIMLTAFGFAYLVKSEAIARFNDQ